MTREQAGHMRFIQLHVHLQDVREMLAQPQNSIDQWETLRKTEIYLEDEIEHMESVLFPDMKKAAGQGDFQLEHSRHVLSSTIPPYGGDNKGLAIHA